MRGSRHNLSLKLLILLLIVLSVIYISLISSEQWDSAVSEDVDELAGVREDTAVRQGSDKERQGAHKIAVTTPDWVEINAIRIPKAAGQIVGERRKKRKLFVIIVAGFRTGSTLLGEFFNKNKEIFYIFEPLHQVLTCFFHFSTCESLVYHFQNFALRICQNTLVT